MYDRFIVCPHCGSSVCFEQHLEENVAWCCMTCGFTSTTLMKEGTETEQQISSNNPTLYKDLKFVDEQGFVWYPSVVSVPGKGTVYVDGSNTKNWEWVLTPMRPLTKKEKRMKKYADMEYLIDLKNTKRFGKDGYTLAMQELGLFGDE